MPRLRARAPVRVPRLRVQAQGRVQVQGRVQAQVRVQAQGRVQARGQARVQALGRVSAAVEACVSYTFGPVAARNCPGDRSNT